jgi:ankyrin repeat protein
MVIQRKHLAGFALGGLLLGGALMALVAGIGTPGVRDQRIVDAAEKQDMAGVRTLLERGVDPNSTQPDGATALHWAVHWDDLATTEVLIGEGANVDAANEYGATPLSLACTNGNGTMVQALLDAGANANTAAPSGETALMRCARSGRADAVKALLAHGAQINAKDNENGQTALMWAVSQKHPEAVQALIEGDADVHARSNGGFSALMFAARVGDAKSAELLLAAGADVNEKGPQGMTPLVLASASGQEEAGILLLEKGADANAKDEFGATALHYAVTKGITSLNGVRYANYVSYLFRPSEPKLVEALLKHGANPNAQLEKGPPLGGGGSPAAVGATPFLLAAASPDANVMRMLAAAGADPNLPTNTGLTPLMVAAGAARGQDLTEDEKRIALEAVQLAVELGGDVTATNQDGLTALHGAAANGADEVVQFLVAKGAKLDVRDKYQQTPLSIAAGERLPWIPYGEELGEIIQPSTRDLLLKLGATPLDTPGYFKPPSEESDAYRINRSQRGLEPQSQP